MSIIDNVIVRQVGIDSQYNMLHYADSNYELIHVISGKGNIIINGGFFPLTPNTVYVIDGAYLHCTVPSTDPVYIRNKIYFRKQALLQTLKEAGIGDETGAFFPPSGRISSLSIRQSDELDELFQKLAKAPEENEFLRFSLGIDILKIVSEGASATERNVDPLIIEVFQYINANIAEDLSIDSIAGAAHVNKYYLCHKFREATNMTIGQYIRNCRISVAKQMLSETNRTVSDISYEVGFENFSHFTRVFREVTGITPTNFRKQSKIQNQ